MSLRSFLLNNPKDRHDFLVFVANKTSQILDATLGLGFISHDQPALILPNVIWNSVELDLLQSEKLDLVIEQFRDDIVKTGVRHFCRFIGPGFNNDGFLVIEAKNGISFRLSIQLNSRTQTPKLVLEYLGWK